MGDKVSSNKQRSRRGDRVLLDTESIGILETLDRQISSAFGKTVIVSHRDKVLFLLKARSVELTHQELGKLKDIHFNEVRALNIAIGQVKQAKADGREISLAEIMKQITSPELSDSKKQRRSKVSTPSEGSATKSGIDLSSVKVD